MIKKLILENWKSHLYSELEFEQGYNVIVGNVGSGKSSIVEALTYALFGTVQSLSSRKILSKDLIMAKPMPMDSAKIKLEFQIDSDLYLVERLIYKEKSNQAKLYKNGSLIRGPKPSDVNEEIEKIIGINIDAFMRANYSEQNQIDFFLNMPSSQRKQLFDSIFGIDFYETLGSTSKTVSNKLKSLTSEKQGYINELKAVIDNYNINELNNSLSKIKEDVESNNLRVNDIDSKVIILKSKLDLQISIQKQFENMSKEYEFISGQLKVLSNQISGINYDKIDLELDIQSKLIVEKRNQLTLLNKEKDLYKINDTNFIRISQELLNISSILDKNNQEIESSRNIEIFPSNLEEELTNINKNYTELLSKINIITLQLKDIDNKLQDIQKVEDKFESIKPRLLPLLDLNLEQRITDISSLITKDNDLLSNLNAHMEFTQKSLNELSNAASICPTCEQKLDDNHKHSIIDLRSNNISEYQQKIQNLIKIIDRNKLELLNTQNDFIFVQKNISLYQEYILKTSTKESIISDRNSMIRISLESKSELDDLIKQKDIIEKKVIQSKQLKLIEQRTELLRKENLALLARKDTLDKEIITIKEYLNNNKDLDNKTDIIKEEIISIENNINNLKSAKSYFELLKKSEKITKDIESLGYDKNIHQNIHKDLLELESSKTYMNTILNQNIKLLGDINFNINQYNVLNQKLTTEQQRISKINTMSDDLGVISSVARKTQEDVREMMISNINIIFMDLWPRVYPYNDFNQIKFDIIDGDYKLELYFDKGYKRPLDDFVSGGERSSLALTLRIAMSLVMRNKLGILILDEPTHNLDSNSVVNLSRLFNDHLQQFTKQIFVITHDRELENYAKSVYYVKRDKDSDMPSSVEHLR